MIFTLPEYDNHHSVHFFHDDKTELKAIIALHRVALRAAGGVRMMNYDAPVDAVRDALRLSRAMTYKWALAGVPELGGGKTVIIGDPHRDKTPALMQALGRFIDFLNGKYVCGADVGTNANDMGEIRKSTPHVRGVPGEGGDTSPPTGIGVQWAMRAAIEQHLGTASIKGLKVAIQGAGGVGSMLAGRLHEEGAQILIADIDSEAAARVANETGATICDPDEIIDAEAEVFAPCALGGILRENSIERIKARIICGGANNQLASPEIAIKLDKMGKLYIPDYVANAGGIIAARRHGPEYQEDEGIKATERIYETTLEILQIAAREKITPHLAAETLAKQRIAEYDANQAAS